MRVIELMAPLAFSAKEITDLFVLVGAVGAALFSWGLGSYQKFRSARRKEDDEDRRSMRESVIENTKLICEAELRQKDLQKEFDKLSVQLKRLQFEHPDEPEL